MLPRNAEMDSKIFTTERKICSLCSPLVNSTEQDSSLKVFEMAFRSVKFVRSAIFLRYVSRAKIVICYDISLVIMRTSMLYSTCQSKGR